MNDFLFRWLFPFSTYILCSRLSVVQALGALSQSLCFHAQLPALLCLKNQDVNLNIKVLQRLRCFFLLPLNEPFFSFSCYLSGKMQRVWKLTDCSCDATLDHSPKVSAGISLAALQNLQRLPSPPPPGCKTFDGWCNGGASAPSPSPTHREEAGITDGQRRRHSIPAALD